MKERDNNTRKTHISSKFILSISILIMFDTLLLGPSLHCNKYPWVLFITCHCKYRLPLYGCISCGGVEAVLVPETYCCNTVLEAGLKKGTYSVPETRGV